jgi:uncharacterized Zn-binding protein involved in type VI secretion
MNATPEKIRQCRSIAFAGIAVMAVGSFLSCLAQGDTNIMLGSGILLLGIAITSYGFAYWRP